MVQPLSVAVTGSSGMLGSALLSAGWDDVEWLGIDIRPPVGPTPDVFRRIDVRDTESLTEAFRGIEVVVHAAAALPSYSASEIAAVDVRGTESVLAAAKRAGVGRVVHVSSTAVYGLPRLCPTPEDYPCEPVDPYSAAKREAEVLVERARRDGLCAPILRPKTFLGENRLGLFAMLFEWADEGRDFPLLGGGRNRAQMLDVADLCAAVRAACTLPDAQVDDTFNIGADRFGSIGEEFQAVLDAAGRGGRVRALPVLPAVAALRVLAALRLSPVYARLIHKLTRDSFVAVDKAAERLGFAPEYGNEESLLRTYAWWREAGSRSRTIGRTHRDAWRQGALRLAKAFC
ncbi:NAD-dependent epimerase/dehydratase family protein [Actinoallomurus acaciae]|uniref:NAD-dependent epimerase/dehydratase family protein n=1 Tax=Actinoallomurus acaciae TaxID=502577 RepID=A0ABV5YQE2_9ACTN